MDLHHNPLAGQLVLEAICSDWDAVPAKLRKALSYRDGCSLHTTCGMFIHFLDALQNRAPAAEFPEFESKLTETFMGGVMDPELTYCAEHSVPPGDVCAIGAFRLGVPFDFGFTG